MIWLLLFFLPSQLGLHFWPEWSMVHGVRIDYLSPTLYFTDLIIAIIWTFSKLSITPRPPLNLRGGVRRTRVILLLLIVLNIFFSQSPFVSIYRWLRFYEYFWLFKYLVKKDLSLATCYLSLPAIWVSLLTWSQFLLQHSLGGFWYFLGERKFDITTIGIARTLTPIGLMLRPYATFPHPNALAAFLLLMAMILKKGKIFWLIMLTIPLTLSRTGIALEAMLLIYMFIKNNTLKITLAGISLALLLFIPGSPDSLSQRVSLFKSGIETVVKYPLWGLGLGNFVSQTPAYRFQPVHNVPVLALSELGLPLFVYLIILTLKHLLQISTTVRKASKFQIALAVLLITASVDHYWWTLPQMQLLLTIFLAVAVQLNHGGICGLYRWRSTGKSRPRSLRVRSSKQ